MQKTLSGQHSHLDTVPVAIFDNDQDIDALAARIGLWSADIPEGVERKNASNDDPAYHEYIKNAHVISSEKDSSRETSGLLY